jgi:acetyl-CoA acetyltransferase
LPVKDQNGLTILDRDEHMRPGTDMQSLASLNAVLRHARPDGRLRGRRHPGHPEIEAINYVHHAGNSSGIVDGAAGVLLGSKRGGKTMGIDAARQDQGLRQYRLRPDAYADRPGRRDRKTPEAGEDEDRGH